MQHIDILPICQEPPIHFPNAELWYQLQSLYGPKENPCP